MGSRDNGPGSSQALIIHPGEEPAQSDTPDKKLRGIHLNQVIWCVIGVLEVNLGGEVLLEAGE